MPLILSDEARMVRETALDFFRERSPVTGLRKLRDDNDPVGFSRVLWRQMADLGWAGFLVAEEDGGPHGIQRIVLLQPAHHLRRGVLQGLVEGPGVAGGEDEALVLSTRPPDMLTLQNLNGELNLYS